MTILAELTESAPRLCGDARIRTAEDIRVNARGIGSFCLFDQYTLSPDALNSVRLDMADKSAELDPELALDMIYPPAHEVCAARSLVKEYNIQERIGDAQFAVILVDGNDPRSAAARRVEAKRFYHEFGIHPAKHEKSFSKYSDVSTLLYMMDMADPENPISAGVIRFIRPSEKNGLKTINLLSSDEFDGTETLNPWFNDFSAKITGFAEADQETRKAMIYDFFNLDPEKTWDIPTMAVDERYKGHNFGPTPAWGLYAACIQVPPRMGATSFINTQDKGPFDKIQFHFGRPWTDGKTPDENGNPGKYGFSEIPHEGEAPVVPTAMLDIVKSSSQFKIKKPKRAALLFDLNTYGKLFKTPLDLQPELFKSE